SLLAVHLSSIQPPLSYPFSFSCNRAATTAIYSLSLHDALPICQLVLVDHVAGLARIGDDAEPALAGAAFLGINVVLQVVDVASRSEEHTSELQSRENLVCRLLLEKKKSR